VPHSEPTHHALLSAVSERDKEIERLKRERLRFARLLAETWATGDANWSQVAHSMDTGLAEINSTLRRAEQVSERAVAYDLWSLSIDECLARLHLLESVLGDLEKLPSALQPGSQVWEESGIVAGRIEEIRSVLRKKFSRLSPDQHHERNLRFDQRLEKLEVVGTGGGCVAYEMALPDGGYMLLTDDDAGIGFTDPLSEEFYLGRYDKDGDPLETVGPGGSGDDSSDALSAALAALFSVAKESPAAPSAYCSCGDPQEKPVPINGETVRVCGRCKKEMP